MCKLSCEQGDEYRPPPGQLDRRLGGGDVRAVEPRRTNHSGKVRRCLAAVREAKAQFNGGTQFPRERPTENGRFNRDFGKARAGGRGRRRNGLGDGAGDRNGRRDGSVRWQNRVQRKACRQRSLWRVFRWRRIRMRRWGCRVARSIFGAVMGNTETTMRETKALSRDPRDQQKTRAQTHQRIEEHRSRLHNLLKLSVQPNNGN